MKGTGVRDSRHQQRGVGSILLEGVVAGVLGGTTLAAWFLVVDWIQGVPLLTPSILGSLLLFGDAEVAGGHPVMAAVAAFTVVHYLLFGAAGLAAAALARQAERRPAVLLGALLFLAALQAFSLSFVAVFAEALFGTLRWWVIVLGNLLALAAMGAYLGSRHPGAKQVLDDEEVFESR